MKKSGKRLSYAAGALLIVAVGLAFWPFYQNDSDGREHNCGSFLVRAADRCHSGEYANTGAFIASILGMAVVTAVAAFMARKPENRPSEVDHWVPATSARAAWKSVGVARRREVFRLLKRGERHPEPDVAAAAYSWSHSSAWESWTNRAPGWLLPGLGLALLTASLTLGGAGVFSLAGGFVILAGLMGWNSRACAARLRQVYDTPPAPALTPTAVAASDGD